jgi:flagellar secretion chaperone FliS
MSDRPQNEYLRAKIMTASPQQLQTMLYDGAIRFCEQARAAMETHDVAATHDRLLRAQKIVLELSTSMKIELAPEMCRKLVSLYNYVYRLLITANLNKDLAKLDEAINLLRYQRETWLMALESLRRPASAASEAAAPSAVAPEAAAKTATAAAAPSSKTPAKGGAAAPAGAGGILSIEG